MCLHGVVDALSSTVNCHRQSLLQKRKHHENSILQQVQTRHHERNPKANADLRHATQTALLRARVLVKRLLGMEAKM
jgi:hypothetical protein